MNKIDYENLTEEEAQEILDSLCNTFNITAKCWGFEFEMDVFYLTAISKFDDNFYTQFSKRFANYEYLIKSINKELNNVDEHK